LSRPEEKARKNIDSLLTATGWSVQNLDEYSFGASIGVAIREFSVERYARAGQNDLPFRLKADKYNLLLSYILIAVILTSIPQISAFFIHSSIQSGTQTVQIGDLSAWATSYDRENSMSISEIAIADINRYMAENDLPYRFEALVDQATEELEKYLSFWAMDVDLFIGERPIPPEYGQPLISLSSMRMPAHDNLFAINPSDMKQGLTIAEMILNQGIKTIIVIQDKFVGDGIFNLLEREYVAQGGIIAGRIQWSLEDTEFSSYLTEAENRALDQVNQHGAESVGVVVLCNSELATLITQAKEYPTLWSLTWFSSDGATQSNNILIDAPEEAAHLKIFSPHISPSQSSEYSVLNDRFYASTGRSLGFYDAVHYDAYWLYALSVVRAGSSDYKDVRGVLPDVANSYFGVSGWLKLDADGNRKTASYTLWSYGYEDGEPSFIISGYYDGVSGDIFWEKDFLEDSSLSCLVSPSAVNVGKSLMVLGSITPPISDADVTLTYIMPDGSTSTSTVTTNPEGDYSDTLTPYVSGTWHVQVSWKGDLTFYGTVSSLFSFTVTRISTIISLRTSKVNIAEGDSITVLGSIDPSISGVKVIIHFTKSDGSIVTKTTSTSSDGSYIYTYTPIEADQYSVMARWEGDETLEGATSQTIEFTALPPQGSLTIMLIDEEGNPIGDATISPSQHPQGLQPLSGTSGPDGSIHFIDVNIGYVEFQVNKKGYYSENYGATVNESVTTLMTIQLEKQVGNLKIVINDVEGKPVSSVDVDSYSQPSGQSSIGGASGSDGSTTFTEIMVGDYTFQTSKNGYSSMLFSVHVSLGESVVQTITLEKNVPRKGIPSFPNESIFLGLVFGVLFFRLMQCTLARAPMRNA